MPDRPVDLAPFTSDADYIEYALEGFLAARVARIAAERDLLDAVRCPTPRADRILCRPRKAQPEEAVQTKHLEALAVEAQVTADYKARLEAHRETRGAFVLGIDRTVEAFGLNDHERLVLLSLAAPCIGQEFAERILAGLELRCFGGGMLVENLLTLLDPETVAQRVQFRSYFHRTSRLCESGLLTIDFGSHLRTPDEFLENQVRLSPYAFGCLLGLSPEFVDAEREVEGKV